MVRFEDGEGIEKKEEKFAVDDKNTRKKLSFSRFYSEVRSLLPRLFFHKNFFSPHTNFQTSSNVTATVFVFSLSNSTSVQDISEKFSDGVLITPICFYIPYGNFTIDRYSEIFL